MQKDIIALVVIYNKNCKESLTIQSLEKNRRYIKHIWVYDNSDKDFKNAEYCEKNDFKYLSQNKNVGLSKAYNYCINKINKNENKYIMILDDDTRLEEDYFKEIETTKKEHDIIIPIVIANKKIISPAKVIHNCRIKSIEKQSEINENNISAINSGMLVKSTIYERIKYNEDLFLDYVDHDFMKRVREEKYKVHVMKCKIIQSFSREEETRIESAISRYKIYRKDFKKYCIGCGKSKIIYYYLNMTKLLIKYFFKYKKISIIVKCLGG